jgi:hypothetical protein
MLASRLQTDPNVSGVAHILTGQSESRVSITFFPPSQGAAFLTNEPGGAALPGIFITQGQTHVHLNVHDHGDCVQREWYVVYSGPLTVGVSWIESLATCAEDQRRHFGASTSARGSLWDVPAVGNALY